MRIFKLDKGGFTLVEIMIAIVITLVALLGLLQAIAMVGDQNLKNMQRDEAVQISEEQMNQFRVLPYNQIVITPGAQYTYAPTTVNSRLRSGAGRYTVTRTTNASADGAQINLGVRVDWTYKNEAYFHEVHSIRAE